MAKSLKILNLYAGIGGNRKLWGDEHDITAVGINEQVAAVYCKHFPNDKMIIGDAHQYLLDHYHEFDFIWSSPPCPTHSRTNYFTQHIAKVPSYPDMKLWQEIIYLNQFHKGLWIVENVIPYYEPFLPMFKQIGRHFIWSNFKIPVIELPKDEIGTMMKQYVGTGKHAHDKKQEERNAVNPKLGLHILNCAQGIIEKETTQLSFL
jgi:DNA (cytosine-5)-methyltransferase 1